MVGTMEIQSKMSQELKKLYILLAVKHYAWDQPQRMTTSHFIIFTPFAGRKLKTKKKQFMDRAAFCRYTKTQTSYWPGAHGAETSSLRPQTPGSLWLLKERQGMA
ncbi:MAG: hypothetical protein GX171_01910 [Clostridiales bacterium]|jgi:hypothetical protein|nr:hypothetical protein [Clostridiales bacterium]